MERASPTQLGGTRQGSEAAGIIGSIQAAHRRLPGHPPEAGHPLDHPPCDVTGLGTLPQPLT